MPKTVAELIADALNPIKLKILVFGPDVKIISQDERTRNLQHKRNEIRLALENDGHEVKYAEDLVDPSLMGPQANAIFQELVIMAEYDLIVNLVGSPGSIVEATLSATRPRLAQKTALYLDQDHISGLVGSACELARTLGAHFRTFKYPEDLVECHLLGHVASRAAAVKLAKYLL